MTLSAFSTHLKTLRDKALNERPSAWLERNYRVPVSGGVMPYGYERYGYIRDILDCRNREVCVMKSAQKGLTVAMMGLALYHVVARKQNVLMVFPTMATIGSFTQGRLDPAIALSPVLAEAFTKTSNVQHKVAGTANLYIRGSNSESSLLEIPVDKIYRDERDRHHCEHFDSVALAKDRLNASREPQEFNYCTPTLPDFGIDAEWKDSSRDEWHFRCPRCNRWERPVWPESVEWIDGEPETARYRCTQCHGDFTRHEMLEAEGCWIAAEPQHKRRGFKVSGLYSPVMELSDIVHRFEAARGDSGKEAVWFNGTLGESFTTADAGLTVELVEEARRRGGYPAGTPETPMCMGIDVGTMLDYTIATFRRDGTRHEIQSGRAYDFEQIEQLMQKFDIRMTVIDAMPEQRKAREFVDRHQDRAFRCYYSGQRGELKVETSDRSVAVDRTEWIDAYFARFYRGEIELPANLPNEYVKHHTAMRKQLVENATGKIEARYVTPQGRPDHLAHAGVYCEVAGRLMNASWGTMWL